MKEFKAIAKDLGTAGEYCPNEAALGEKKLPLILWSSAQRAGGRGGAQRGNLPSDELEWKIESFRFPPFPHEKISEETPEKDSGQVPSISRPPNRGKWAWNIDTYEKVHTRGTLVLDCN